MRPKNYTIVEKMLDGRLLRIRAIRPLDKQALHDTFHRLSRRSVYFRFLGDKKDLSEEELTYLTELDFVRRVALVAVVGEDKRERIVGVGRYTVLGDHEREQRADLAIAVEDVFHGLGVGTLLLRHLAEIARQRGVTVFEADVLPDNDKMVEVFANCGLPLQTRVQAGMLHITLSIGG